MKQSSLTLIALMSLGLIFGSLSSFYEPEFARADDCVVRSLTQEPTQGQSGTEFTLRGTGFTPNTTTTLYFWKPDYTTYDEKEVSVDAEGKFEINHTFPSDLPSDDYWITAIDSLHSSGCFPPASDFTITEAISSSDKILGDIDNNEGIDLRDAITALQLCAGMNPSLNPSIDSSKVGLKEAIFALQILTNSAVLSHGHAVLGPLSGATVRVYRLTDLGTPVYTTQTDADGYFDLTFGGVSSDDYILVTVTGGEDTDADDDGVTDAQPTPNSGTICALMSMTDLNAGGFRVSALTDIAWQYTRNLVGQADNDGLQIRLNDLARTFFTEDVNGDGSLDSKDIPAFSPLDATHKSRLNFDFQILSAQNEDGSSIISCYHNDLKDVLPELLEDNFGSRFSLYPGTDVRYDKVKIEVTAFGRGSFKSDRGGIDFDSERGNLQDNITSAFFEQDGVSKVTLTATPTSDTEILSWSGCDSVSEDKTECEFGLRTDRLVSVSFGYKEAALKAGVTLADLTDAAVTMSEDQVTINVTADSEDTSMAETLAALKSGDFVVGSADAGFLRKVVSAEKVSEYNYILTTEDAALDEVVGQGTGIFLQADDPCRSGRRGRFTREQKRNDGVSGN